MKAFFWIALLGFWALAGCASKPPDVITRYQPITGVRTDLMSENMLETGQTPPREVIWLNASRVFKDIWNKKYAAYLEVSYMAREETGLIDIPFGQSLILTVDGKEMRFAGNGSYNRRGKPQPGFVSETALYEVSPDQLRQIAEARTVRVRIKGNNGLVEREFRPQNFERFREFVARAAPREG